MFWRGRRHRQGKVCEFKIWGEIWVLETDEQNVNREALDQWRNKTQKLMDNFKMSASRHSLSKDDWVKCMEPIVLSMSIEDMERRFPTQLLCLKKLKQMFDF